jgi:3-phosphoshikimate 1-carboxyvinyltransferase
MKSATSPWAKLTNVDKLHIGSSKISDFRVRVPGSKSFSNRALILAACSNGTTEITGLLKSDDTFWCIEALKQLGVSISISDSSIIIEGSAGIFKSSNEPIFIGAAGTTARFLPGVLCANKDVEFSIEADETLSNRPISPLITALTQLGAKFSHLVKEGHLPVKISANGLSGETIQLPGNVSSQYLSGLLICSPLATGDVKIKLTTSIVQHMYVQMTISAMKTFGVTVDVNDKFDEFTIKPQQYKSTQFNVESDVSSSGYFAGLAAINGVTGVIEGLNPNTMQPDIELLDVLERMGCSVVKESDSVTIKGPETLIGGFTVSLKEFSDQALTLGCIAPFANAPITITDVAHIRKHECDRLDALSNGLNALGIETETTEDSITIYPGKPVASSIRTYHDHRVAMAFSMLGSRCNGVEIENPSCVAKTFPNFFEVLESLDIQIKI